MDFEDRTGGGSQRRSPTRMVPASSWATMHKRPPTRAGEARFVPWLYGEHLRARSPDLGSAS
jgi:hypothetical protein